MTTQATPFHAYGTANSRTHFPGSEPSALCNLIATSLALPWGALECPNPFTALTATQAAALHVCCTRSRCNHILRASATVPGASNACTHVPWSVPAYRSLTFAAILGVAETEGCCGDCVDLCWHFKSATTLLQSLHD
jgi:hypothetical protein